MKKLIVCDLSAIENRVLGWMAGCPGILEVFEKGQCPYLSFASKMYKVPYESLIKIVDGVHKPKDKDAAAKRQIGKPAVLGCGYQLSGGRLEINDYGDEVKTGLWGYAENMGVHMTQEEAHTAVSVFRDSYPEVVSFWGELERASIATLITGRESEAGKYIGFERKSLNGKNVLMMRLPSGRRLHYINAHLEPIEIKGKNGRTYTKDCIIYDGIGHGRGKIGSGWSRTKLYSGKELENGDQAISRDVLCHGILLADEMGFELIGSSHDELIAIGGTEPLDLSLEDLRQCMVAVPPWAKGLPLAADGYESAYYKK